MRRLRRCKIVATLGPVSTPDEMLAKLFAAGVDVFRINMSHTSHEELRARVFALREVAKRYQRPVAILVRSPGSQAAHRHLRGRRRGTAAAGTASRSTTIPRPATPPASTCPIPRSSRR